MRGEIKAGTMVIALDPGYPAHQHLAGRFGTCVRIDPPFWPHQYVVQFEPCHIARSGLWHCTRSQLMPVDPDPDLVDVDVLATIPNEDDLIVV